MTSRERSAEYPAGRPASAVPPAPDVPRCVVCGGPFADGSGCEFCPGLTGGMRPSASAVDMLHESSDHDV